MLSVANVPVASQTASGTFFVLDPQSLAIFHLKQDCKDCWGGPRELYCYEKGRKAPRVFVLRQKIAIAEKSCEKLA